MVHNGNDHDDGVMQAQLRLWGFPKELIEGLLGYNTRLTYLPRSLIFTEGSPADIFFWIVSGIAKVYCPQPDGSRIMVRLAGRGDALGHFDTLDPKGKWVRFLEAEALTKVTLAMVTRSHLVQLLQGLSPNELVALMQRLNSAWSAWVHHFAVLFGLSFRSRLEVTLSDLGTRFGIRDKEGLLLACDLSHADLAEMIGSSRPMVTRIMAELTEEGVITRRGKRLVLVRGRRLAPALPESTPITVNYEVKTKPLVIQRSVRPIAQAV